ncbi:hypothetical protein BS78_06G128100 [Paspalum vaginatum]|nr:hypothetical protein BS78_06G128100 [Paspalum vaginatum]
MAKQKTVIKVTMPGEKSRSQALGLTARAKGVTSMEITGDGKDQLEVVGDGIDIACLVKCLRKKVGYADILKIEVVEGKPEKKPEEPMPSTPCPPPCRCSDYYYYAPPPMLLCEEPSSSCHIM